MPKSYELKKKEIKYSLNRRSRLRKAYFKMTGSERPVETLESKDLDVDQPDSEDEDKDSKNSKKPVAPTLNKKQIAAKRRAEKYHKMKEAQERREQAEIKRKIKQKKATARTKKGQPKLGAQVGLLLDKIRETQN